MREENMTAKSPPKLTVGLLVSDNFGLQSNIGILWNWKFETRHIPELGEPDKGVGADCHFG